MHTAFEELLLEGVGDRHFYFTIGKGGVGKTTVSILAALTLSRRAQTLLASLDPAKHLLEYLRLPKPGVMRRVAPGFDAVQYDVDSYAKKVSSEYAELLKSALPGLRIVNLEGVADSIRYSPGFEEEIFLRIISQLYESRYKFVVIDTPPTGITRRILNMPRLYLFWLEKLREIREKIVSLRYAIARAMEREFEPYDPVLRKINEMIRRYKTLWEKLRDPHTTSVILVATPEPLPVYELRETLKLLRKLGIRPRLIVVNKILPRETAENLGVHEIQERAIKELKSLECCPVIGIIHHTTPPKTLEEATQLLRLIRTI